MNIGKKTSWQVAAVSAAALVAGVAQAHDRHRDRHDRDFGPRHHESWQDHSRHEHNWHDRRWRGHDRYYERRYSVYPRHRYNYRVWTPPLPPLPPPPPWHPEFRR